MQQAPAAFMKAASESYKKLGEAERSNLQVEAKASLKEHPLSRKGVINQGGRIFKSMQPKVCIIYNYNCLFPSLV